MSHILNSGINFTDDAQGNKELIERDKDIYKIAEYYGIRPKDINNMMMWVGVDLKDHLVRMLDTNVFKDDTLNPIRVVEEHFYDLGQPFPQGGYLGYKKSLNGPKQDTRTSEGDALAENENTGDDGDNGATVTVGEDARPKTGKSK